MDLTFARLVPMASLQGYASQEVEQLTQRVVQLAATAQNDVILINAHMNAQIACHHLGEFRQARDYAAEVRALASQVLYPGRCVSILDPVVASLSESARNWWITGYFARACADCEAAVALGRELRHPDSLAFAWVFHAWIHGYRGDWSTCLASAAAGIAIARESGSVQTLAWNQCVHGWALAHFGEVRAGESELLAAINESKRIMGELALPQLSVMMAKYYFCVKNWAAETWLKEASEFGRSHDDRYFDSELQRLSALCRARRGEIQDACAGLHEAIQVVRSQDAATFELRAALSLARLEPREGRKATRCALDRIREPEPWPEVTAAHGILQ